uniref:Uncharacterized protein n=1 Tax=Timema cristinae TaxID=61476 RepID=A0A7R9CBE7_TIMCR|nr:unnamed protein product [Timema cristinae]
MTSQSLNQGSSPHLRPHFVPKGNDHPTENQMKLQKKVNDLQLLEGESPVTHRDATTQEYRDLYATGMQGCPDSFHSRVHQQSTPGSSDYPTILPHSFQPPPPSKCIHLPHFTGRPAPCFDPAHIGTPDRQPFTLDKNEVVECYVIRPTFPEWQERAGAIARESGALCNHVCNPTPRTDALSTLCAGVKESPTLRLVENDIIGLEIPPSHIFLAGQY